MMTGKEALEKLCTKQVAIALFNIVANGKYDMNEIVPYFDRIDKAIAELEELKRDVKRYFELKDDSNTYYDEEKLKELSLLSIKVRKVGKEE